MPLPLLEITRALGVKELLIKSLKSQDIESRAIFARRRKADFAPF
jgi:hypothetical protein